MAVQTMAKLEEDGVRKKLMATLVVFTLALSALVCGCSSSPANGGKPPVPANSGITDKEWDLVLKMDGLIRQWNSAYENVRLAEQEKITKDLQKLVDNNFEFTAGLLARDDVELQVVAAGAIGYSRDKRALPALLAALDDSKTEVRQTACGGIGILGDKTTPIEPLLKLLSSDAAGVRQSAAFAIMRTLEPGKDKGAFNAVVAGLRDTDMRVRNECVRTLGVIGNKDAIPHLLVTLKDDDWLVRLNSAIMLTLFKDYSTVESLILALNDSDRRVRRNVRDALKCLTGEDNGDEPALWRQWWKNNKDRYLKAVQPKEQLKTPEQEKQPALPPAEQPKPSNPEKAPQEPPQAK
jgi:hypothetical protein